MVGADVRFELGPGALVCWVAVQIGVGVVEGVGVGVMDAVGVVVGVSEIVAVGAVAVGKGPISALSVIARAVLVLFALRSASGSFDPLPKAITKIKPINRPATPRVCK